MLEEISNKKQGIYLQKQRKTKHIGTGFVAVRSEFKKNFILSCLMICYVVKYVKEMFEHFEKENHPWEGKSIPSKR